MRFLPWIEGFDFLGIYALYTVFLLLLAYLLCKKDKDDFMIQNINEDEYFILNNYRNYNQRAIIKYFTMKLFSKGYIKSVNTNNASFISIDNKSMYELNMLERVLYIQYKNELQLSKIVIDSELEREMLGFYNDTMNTLKSKGLFENEEKRNTRRKKMNIISFFIIVPGVWRLIGGILNGMPSDFLLVETLLIIVITLIVRSSLVGSIVSDSGRLSQRCYRDSYSRKYSSANKDIEDENVNNSDFMAYFLLFNHGNEFFGHEHHNTDHDFFNSGSSCSSCTTNSCSSCSSDSGGSSCGGSSCSSCSSGCGGCGGGSD
ncbi:MAG: hypothetical protein ACRC7N_08380 [Clostridium sp.]